MARHRTLIPTYGGSTPPSPTSYNFNRLIMSQGGNANISGDRLEKRVESLLSPYTYIRQHKYTSIYGHNAKMDFYVVDLDLAIECKNQDVNGSVAEKIPFVLESFEMHNAKNCLLVLGGRYWPTRPGIKSWVTNKSLSSSKNILAVYEDEVGEFFEQANFRRAA